LTLLFATQGEIAATGFALLIGGVISIYLWVKDRTLNSQGAEITRLTARVEYVEKEKRDMEARHDTEIDKLRAQFEKLSKEHQSYLQRILVLETEQGNLPFPMWEMDEHECYAWANQAFLDQFLSPDGKSFDDIVGKKHQEVWSAPLSDQLRIISHAARTNVNRVAWARNVNFKDGWPMYVAAKGVRTVGRRKIGTMGIALNQNHEIDLAKETIPKP
jgi:hypothetical protein